MYSSTAFAYHLLISLRPSSTRITLAEPAIPGDVVDVLIHSSVVQNTIIDSTVDNLTVNDSLTGQIGGGEETLGLAVLHS